MGAGVNASFGWRGARGGPLVLAWLPVLPSK